MTKIDKFSIDAIAELAVQASSGAGCCELLPAFLAVAPSAELRILHDQLGILVILRLRVAYTDRVTAVLGYHIDLDAAARRCAEAVVRRSVEWTASE